MESLVKTLIGVLLITDNKTKKEIKICNESIANRLERLIKIKNKIINIDK